MSTRAPRQANIELLRILAMLAVIMVHYLGVGGVMTGSTGGYFVATGTLYSFAMVCTSVYVLIGGYFLATSKFRTGRIFRLLLEFFTYTFGLYLLFCLAVYVKNGDVMFSWHEFLTFYLFPVVHEENWFVTCYLIMVLLSPFYNILLQHLTKAQHRLLIGILLFLFCLIPTVIWNASWQFLQGNGYSFVWFSVLYFIAAYFRLYGFPKTMTTPKLVLTYAVASCITALLVNHEAFRPGYLTENANGYYYFFNYNFATILVASVAVFLLFHKVNIKSEKTARAINKIASYSFAVFLIHTHPSVAGVLWHSVFHTDSLVNTPALFLWLVLAPILVYAVCMAVEQLRLWVEKPLLNSKKLNTWFAELDERSGLNETLAKH